MYSQNNLCIKKLNRSSSLFSFCLCASFYFVTRFAGAFFGPRTRPTGDARADFASYGLRSLRATARRKHSRCRKENRNQTLAKEKNLNSPRCRPLPRIAERPRMTSAGFQKEITSFVGKMDAAIIIIVVGSSHADKNFFSRLVCRRVGGSGPSIRISDGNARK